MESKKKDCQIEEKSASKASPPMPQDTPGWWVDQPLERVDWMHAFKSPVPTSVRVSWAKASRSGILYAILGISEVNLIDDGRGRVSEPLKL